MSWRAFIATLGIGLALGSTSARAYQEDLTVCWAEWDPALYLFDLSKEFMAETGLQVDFDLVPWPRFADTMLGRLADGDALCDVMIGDSQWIGAGAENGYYVQLNDFFDASGIDLDDYLAATVEAYSVWPKGSSNYYALPAMGDALGWVYRKDWFERPAIRAAFLTQHGRELAVPETWIQILEIAQFFEGREIDGRAVHGVAVYDERASEGITMGVTSALYAFGFDYEMTVGAYDLDGAVNSQTAVEALEFYKTLHDTASPPDLVESYMVGNLDAYARGDVAMQMNWFAFFPGIHADRTVGRGRSGFFANPPQNHRASTLGGQGMSIVASSDNQENAYLFVEWFARSDIQQKWWDFGGYSVHNEVLNAPGFEGSRPFAGEFLEALQVARDFWQEPQYAALLEAMQIRIHDYVVRDEGTAQEALDSLVEDWTVIFDGSGS